MNETATPERMPALYIGHGAPPLLDDALWSSQLAGLAADLPRPKAILIVSAHWESAPLSLSAHRGFFGSRPFSRVNRMLEEQGGTPVDWRLP